MTHQHPSETDTKKWRFWIDRGGTFTDVVAATPDGRLITHKLLSQNPDRYPDAALQGIRDLLGIAAAEPLPAGTIDSIRMGTTVATNALLERKGDPTLLLITKGFRDALRLGNQARPDIFARRIDLPEQLYTRVVEVDERVRADGTVETPLNVDALIPLLEAVRTEGIDGVAIVLLHSYAHPDHEVKLAETARSLGFRQVSVSHEVSPLIKLIGRGDTCVVDAYLTPILQRYVDQVAAEIPSGTRLYFMQSNGGLTEARLFKGKSAVLSGPAGGVVGMARIAERAGFEQVIGFDMGGTSTDVAHYAGEFERAFDTEVAGVRMTVPMMRIHTVAAGGGSICSFDGTKLRVGPESAGADPGPACYRRGGPLTITDCNVLLGKIQPALFPSIFGPEGDQPLDRDLVVARFEALAAEIEAATGLSRSPDALAEGFITIANENMANAIKKISVAEGHDVTRYTLVSFGGAGGQHACAVADSLGVDRVLLHPFAGVLSAYGMGLADVTAMRQASVEAPFDPQMCGLTLAPAFDDLERRVLMELADQGVDPSRVALEKEVHIKVAGTDAPLPVKLARGEEMQAAFADAHRRLFGFEVEDRTLVIDKIALEGVADSDAVDTSLPFHAERPMPTEAVGDWRLFDRGALREDEPVAGPAIVREDIATIVVEPGWQAELRRGGEIVLTRAVPRPSRRSVGTDADPVMLEVFNNLFMHIAEQMGVVLERTAQSVNMKERLDFSCAVFDGDGNLVANAPHMPVHLGSMGESVRHIIEQRGDDVRPGRVYMLNDPYNGGTHLPDITVVTPVYSSDDTDLLFWVASRGHHADVGGLTPGSMPPDSKVLEDEGVLVDDRLLVVEGVFQEADVRTLFADARYPARNISQNIGDLKAQIAANERGIQDLHRMVSLFGLDTVQAYMGHVQANAEEQVRRVVDRLSDGVFELPLDNGTSVRVSVQVDRDRREALVDFTGTSPQSDDNFNAPRAVTRAAVMYVFRTLVEERIPMNEGCLKPIRLKIPSPSMLSPEAPAAVVAGNVEVSQCVTDALYGALGVQAAAQGTMNNLTFGNNVHQYYETICGGAGAGVLADGRGFPGTSGVHTHMTNSRLTDPEVLELRYPVLLEEFRLREATGGDGKWRGGDGTVRRLRFLEAMTAAILANRRKFPPFGLQGGRPGAVGETRVLRRDGSAEILNSVDKRALEPGDAVQVSTPGGGGYGAA